MARIRTVKPDHWKDKELAQISLQAHLFWIGTWNFSDDKGIFEGDPLLLKSLIFPRRTDVRTEQISQWLGQLVKARFVIPFEYNKESYYITRTFETHQRIDKPQPSKIPDSVVNMAFVEYSKNVLGTVVPVEESRVIVEEWKVYRRFAHLELSFEEFEMLSLVHGKGNVDRVLDSIENYSKNKKYKSLYLTAKNWLEKEKVAQKKSNGEPTSKGDKAVESATNIAAKRGWITPNND